MATFPGAIATFRTMVNRVGVLYDALKTKVIYAEDLNKERDEIVAIETELGVNPKGAYASIAAYLSKLASVACDPFLAWSYDPVGTINAGTPTGGLLQLVRIRINSSCIISNIHLWCTTGGAGTTNCYAALYSFAGSLLAQSADLSASMGTAGLKSFVLSSPVSVTAGYYYVAFWATASTTVPSFARGCGNGSPNSLLGTSYRYCTANGSLTNTAPGSLGAKTAGVATYWAGVD